MEIRVKHCGVTTPEDALVCLEHGAWAIGMIFWPGSPRAVDRDGAARIAAVVRRKALLAGVFMNAHLDEVVGLADALSLDLVQLHGDEGAAYCAEVGRRTGLRVIKAARVRDRGDVQALDAFRGADFHLLDGAGGGELFDHDLLGARRSDVPLLVAGGLTAENVGAAIAAAVPFGVDVASGTEREPGVKDPEKVAAFADAVTAAAVGQPA